MVGPKFESPFDRDDRADTITRSTYYLTRRQREKLKDKMLREQANRVRQQLLTKPQFTPMDFNKFDVPSLPEDAQSSILVAQANANNPDPVSREKNANWFMKAMQKWDDWTVSASASPLNPITGAAKSFNPRFGRELARKKKRFEREYLKSGKTSKEAHTLASRAAWRETEYAKTKIFGWEVDPIKFGIEVTSDPSNFLFWGAGAGIKAGVKAGAKRGRRIIAKADVKIGILKGRGVGREERMTIPRNYWLNQSKITIHKVLFKSDDAALNRETTDKFIRWLKLGEEGLDERTLSKFLNDNNIAKSFNTSNRQLKQVYKSPLFKSSKRFLQNGKSDFENLRLLNDPNAIRDLKATGHWVASTESKWLGPLRWMWYWADPAPTRYQTKSGRASLLHGIGEGENKTFVAAAVREYQQRFVKLGVDFRKLDEGNMFGDFIDDSIIKLSKKKGGFGKDAVFARDQLKDWHTFLENAFDSKGNAAKWLKVNEKQKANLKDIVEAWGEHAYHLIENGIAKPEAFGLETIVEKGALKYELNNLRAGGAYIGRIVDSIKDRQIRSGRTAFTKASAEKKRVFKSVDLDPDFDKLLNDDWSIKTLDQAEEQGVKYLNPIATYDIKSGEILQRVNDNKFTNRLKSIGMKKWNASTEVGEWKDKQRLIIETISEFKKHILKLTPKNLFSSLKYADDLQRLVQKTLKNPDATDLEDVLNSMESALNGPIKQRSHHLEKTIQVTRGLNREYTEQNELARELLLHLRIAQEPDLKKLWADRLDRNIIKKDRKLFGPKGELTLSKEREIARKAKIKPSVWSDDIESALRKQDFVVGRSVGGVVQHGTLLELPLFKKYIKDKLSFKKPLNVTQMRELLTGKGIKELPSGRGVLDEFYDQVERLLSDPLRTPGAVNRVQSLKELKNEIDDAKDVFRRLIDWHDANLATRTRATTGIGKLKEVIDKIGTLDRKGIFDKNINKDFYNKLNRFVTDYTSPATNKELRDQIKNELAESLNKLIVKSDNIIMDNDGLYRNLNLIKDNPGIAKKGILRNFRKKDGRFSQREFDDMMNRYPKPLASLLREFQQDPTFAKSITGGIESVEKEWNQVHKALIQQHENLDEVISNYQKTLEGKGRLVDPNDKLKFNEQAKQFLGRDFEKFEMVENVSLKNGIPTKELENYFFDPKTKKAVEAFMGTGSKKFAQLEAEHLGKVGDILRIFKTAFDLGAPMIQGLPLFFTSPAGWARATKNHAKVMFFGKEAIASFYASKREVIQRLMDAGGNVSGEGLDYYAALRKGEWLPRAFSKFDDASAKTGIYGTTLKERAKEGLEPIFGAGALAGRFNDAFDTFGDMARIELFEAFEKTALKKASKAGMEEGLAMQQLADMVNKMTGAFDSRALGKNRGSIALERAFMFFSPRYTRASMSVIADVLLGGSKNGIQGEMARDTLLRMLSGGVTMYTGTIIAKNMLEAEMGVPEAERAKLYLDPRPTSEGGDGGKFMKIQIGEDFIGPGSFWVSALKLTGTILGDPAFRGDKADSPLFFQSEEPRPVTANLLRNPIVMWLRGRTAPISGLAWDLQQKHTFIGEPLESAVDIEKHIATQLAPFWLETGVLKGGIHAAGAIFEFGGFNARETTDWEKLEDVQDQEAQRIHDVNWNDLTLLQKEEIRIANVGTTGDIAAEEERIFKERRKSPLGTEAQAVMGDWYQEMDIIKGRWDEQVQALDLAVQENTLDLPQYIRLIKNVNNEKRMSFKRLKVDPIYQPVYENINYRKFEDTDNVGDYYYDEYMRILTDDVTHSLLPAELQELGIVDEEFVDWDARNAEIASFEEVAGPQIMEYIQARLEIPAIGEGAHPLYQEYLAGRKKYLDLYYRGVEEETIAYHGEQAKEAYREWKNAVNYAVRAEMEKRSPFIRMLLRDMRRARDIMRKTNVELDAFLYRFGIGNTTTLKHPYNKFDFRKGELAMPFPMQTYVPTFTED